MARRKADRKVDSHSSEQMQTALDMIQSGKSIRQAAKCKKLPFATLHRYYKKIQNNTEQANIRLVPNYENNRVFTDTQEQMLIAYLKESANLLYGLSNLNCQKLVYETAVFNKIKVPETWTRNEMAGIDWLKCFRKRHPDLSLRTPESCSLARAAGLNKHNVDKNFEDLMKRRPNFSDETPNENRNHEHTNGSQNFNANDTYPTIPITSVPEEIQNQYDSNIEMKQSPSASSPVSASPRTQHQYGIADDSQSVSLHNYASPEEDHEIFGAFIAAELRGLGNNHTLIRSVKKKIQLTILEAYETYEAQSWKQTSTQTEDGHIQKPHPPPALPDETRIKIEHIDDDDQNAIQSPRIF